MKTIFLNSRVRIIYGHKQTIFCPLLELRVGGSDLFWKISYKVDAFPIPFKKMIFYKYRIFLFNFRIFQLILFCVYKCVLPQPPFDIFIIFIWGLYQYEKSKYFFKSSVFNRATPHPPLTEINWGPSYSHTILFSSLNHAYVA